MAEKLESMDDLLVHELKDLYSAEQMVMESLPKMKDAASSDKLKKAFELHMEQTKKQKETLEKAFQAMGQQPEMIECKGMKGLIEEGKEIMQMRGEGSIKDAALIGAAQKVEHYEMAGYGTARTHAQTLGKNDVAKLLQSVLDQEGETDHKLSALAEETVNPRAASM